LTCYFIFCTIPSTAQPGVGLPKLLRPLVSASLDELQAQKVENLFSSCPIWVCFLPLKAVARKKPRTIVVNLIGHGFLNFVFCYA
jgi:hypothetical protein